MDADKNESLIKLLRAQLNNDKKSPLLKARQKNNQPPNSPRNNQYLNAAQRISPRAKSPMPLKANPNKKIALQTQKNKQRTKSPMNVRKQFE